MPHSITYFEELSANAHPALETLLYDGWVLRFSNGYTRRANSVYPLYTSSEGLSIADKIINCEQFYKKRGLPSVFKITQCGCEELDRLLGENGYEIKVPTNLMTLDLCSSDFLRQNNVIITDRPDANWIEAYCLLSGNSDGMMKKTFGDIIQKIKNRTICARIEMDNKIIACGLGVVERGNVGLYNIIVDKNYRRNGLGFAVCSAVLGQAKADGVQTAYLQVVAENEKAVGLYSKLGFGIKYKYWYRTKGEN